ncbi:FAD-dependent monooxygenase [Mycolicibacterium sp. CBM1]
MAPLNVVVAGGGLGGVTAALALRQRGLQVTVLEAATALGEVGAGIQTAPNASRILIALGLRRELEAIKTEPMDQVRRRWENGKIIALTSLGEFCKQKFNAPYWHYHRADLHSVIHAKCLDPTGPGPVVEFCTDAKVIDVDRTHPARPVAVTADGGRYEADVLIGADGLRSAVRDIIGLPDTLVYSGEMAYRALIPGDRIVKDPATRWLVDRYQSTIWYGPGRHLVHYMIRDGEYLNVVALTPCTDEVRELGPRMAGPAELLEAFADWDDRAHAMLSKADENVLCQALYYRRPDPRWTDGHVALLGDACHAMLPYQAQGASQAMEDAAVLAEELARTTAAGVETALLRYADRRARHARMVQNASLQNKTFYHLPDGPEQEERDAKLASFAGESDISYDWLWRGTPLDDADDENFHYSFVR